MVAEPIVVRYEPDMDGDPDAGEVVWAWIPYEEDPREGKDRPVIVIGRVGSRFAAIALSTKPPRDDDEDDRIAVGTGAWDSEGRPSFAKLDRVFAFRSHQARREGAALAKDRFDRVIAALSRRDDWPNLDVEIVDDVSRDDR